MIKKRLLIGGTIAALAVMFGLATGEKLAKADGRVAAKTLPLDVEFAERKFETATFGIG